MDVGEIYQSQYLAALEMLKQAILKCPQALWDRPGDKNKFWHMAYHALFYTHLYLQRTMAEFTAWSKHRPEINSLGSRSESPIQESQGITAYSKDEILEYFQLVQEETVKQIAVLDLGGESGFQWLPFSKLELLVYNLRHLQQHTGELCERLGTQAEIDVDWVGAKAGL